MSDLKGKVAVVTGASKGIGAGGRQGARGAAGAAVAVNYSSGKDGSGARRRTALPRGGGKAIAVQG